MVYLFFADNLKLSTKNSYLFIGFLTRLKEVEQRYKKVIWT